jgi:hypothetical protein
MFLDKRYRRGDLDAPRLGEHSIENQILIDRFGEINLLGERLIDGVNAFPLSCDFAGGGRRANVEADLLLLSRSIQSHRLVLCEVKTDADDPWFAAVESLRQMRLFLANPAARAVMIHRGALPAEAKVVPVTGLVLAPADYFFAKGKKGNALAPQSDSFSGYGTALPSTCGWQFGTRPATRFTRSKENRMADEEFERGSWHSRDIARHNAIECPIAAAVLHAERAHKSAR